jgi:hypothetical protein
MMGGPIEGLPMTPNVEGRTNLPILGRHGVEVSPTSTHHATAGKPSGRSSYDNHSTTTGDVVVG